MTRLSCIVFAVLAVGALPVASRAAVTPDSATLQTAARSIRSDNSSAFEINPMPIDQSPFQSVVMIRGRAVDGYSGKGLPHVAIYALSTAGSAHTMSNAAGYFYFLDLLPGDYMLAAHSNHLAQCKRPTKERFELEAGYEYEATFWLFSSCH